MYITTNRLYFQFTRSAKMAKLVFALAALLFLFAVSHARTPLNQVVKETNGRDEVETKLPESKAKPTATILLPSEKPNSVVEWDPESADSKISGDGPTILTNEESTEFKDSETVPLTVISFRPINRHFPRRPFPLSFRHGHRCRHGHRQFRPWLQRFHGGEREHDHDRDVHSYGHDMILSSGDDLRFDPGFRGGGARQIPARWVNFRHGGPRFPFRHDEEAEFDRPHHHDHRHHHDRDEREEFAEMERPREHEHRHKHEHEDEGGLMRRFRKFLNRF